MNVTESEIIARERALGNSCRGPKKIMRDPLTASSLFANGSNAPTVTNHILQVQAGQ